MSRDHRLLVGRCRRACPPGGQAWFECLGTPRPAPWDPQAPSQHKETADSGMRHLRSLQTPARPPPVPALLPWPVSPSAGSVHPEVRSPEPVSQQPASFPRCSTRISRDSLLQRQQCWVLAYKGTKQALQEKERDREAARRGAPRLAGRGGLQCTDRGRRTGLKAAEETPTGEEDSPGLHGAGDQGRRRTEQGQKPSTPPSLWFPWLAAVPFKRKLGETGTPGGRAFGCPQGAPGAQHRPAGGRFRPQATVGSFVQAGCFPGQRQLTPSAECRATKAPQRGGALSFAPLGSRGVSHSC